MAKSKIKDSTPVTIRIENSILENLNNFCEVSGQSKTVAIERAIGEYLVAHENLAKEFAKTYTGKGE